MKLRKCEECQIAGRRKNRVIGRGDIPADVLFIGEAPGKAEDLLGEPFVGPSGKLLDVMVETATTRAGLQRPPSYFITNTILCRPYVLEEEDDEYFENREPTKIEILKCMPYVMEIARNVNPQVVIFVGKIAEKYYSKEFEYSARILHPAFLLRFGGIQSPYYLSVIRSLQEIFTQIKHGVYAHT